MGFVGTHLSVLSLESGPFDWAQAGLFGEAGGYVKIVIVVLCRLRCDHDQSIMFRHLKRNISC